MRFSHRFVPAELKVKADMIILAVGQYTEAKDFGLPVNKMQEVEKTEGNLFTCGDIAQDGEKTVVYAVKSAKLTAYKINKFLGGKK